MKKIAILIVSAMLLAGTGVAGSAFAGGDVKLNMGGPLGTFTASGKGKYIGNKGYTSKSYSKKKSSSYSKAAARKKAAARARAIAKKKEIARRKAIAARKASAEKRARIAAQRKASKHRATAQANREAAKAAAAKKNSDVTLNDDATEDSASKSSPVKASAIEGANTLLDEEDEGKAKEDSKSGEQANSNKDDDSLVDMARATPSEDADEELSEVVGSGECSKYVPSAGLTISVPCEE